MAKSKIIEKQTDTQLIKLIKHLLESSCEGQVLDGIGAMRKIEDIYGLYADHHIYTSIMDGMARTGQAEFVGSDYGRTSYLITA